MAITTSIDPEPAESISASYFINITIHQPLLRFKIPKFLVETFRRRFNGGSSAAEEENSSEIEEKERRKEPEKICGVASAISDFSGGRKSPSCCECSDESKAREDDREKIDGSEFSHEHNEREKNYVAQVDDRGAQKEITGGEKSSSGSRFHLSIFTVFSKKKSIDFIRNKFCGGNKNKLDYGRHLPENEAATRSVLFGSREKLKRLLKISSGLLTTHRKQITDGSTELSYHQDDGDGEQLCGKRILMGGRCKPLSASGNLRCDKNGELLPEILH